MCSEYQKYLTTRIVVEGAVGRVWHTFFLTLCGYRVGSVATQVGWLRQYLGQEPPFQERCVIRAGGGPG